MTVKQMLALVASHTKPIAKRPMVIGALVFMLLTIAASLAALRPGFIFLPDFVMGPQIPPPPHMATPIDIQSTILHSLSIAIPSYAVQKLLILVTLFLTGYGAFRMLNGLRPSNAHNGWLAACYMGGVFSVFNPFVYARIMMGQWSVVLGYGLLYWWVTATLAFLKRPSIKNSLSMVAILGAVSIVSVHALAFLALIATAILIVLAVKRTVGLKTLAQRAVAVAVGAFMICSFWLVPLILGHGQIADTISRFTATDAQAFATTTGDIGLVGNVLALQGFWGDARNLYLLPQDVFAWWLLPVLALWALVIWGMVTAWREQRSKLALFGSLGIVGFVLAVGSTGTIFAPFNGWLYSHVPLFTGYREPQKFTALIVLAYVYFVTIGFYRARATLDKTQWKHVAWSLLAIPFLCAPLLLWGGAGQIHTSDYPKGWYAANSYLKQHDTEGKKVLFLPWHLYMPFSFANNRTIVNPAPKFFEVPVVVSQNPEINGAHSYSGDQVVRSLQKDLLPYAQDNPSFAQDLAKLNIGYVIVAREYDYRKYDYLHVVPGLLQVQNSRSIKVYKVTGGEDEKKKVD